MEADRSSPGGGAGRSRAATSGTAIGLLLAAGAAVLIHANSVPPEGPWGAVGFPLVWATPALLGVLALRRPLLLVPAAVASVPLALTSLSGVTVLLLVPAVLWAVAVRRDRPAWPGPARTVGLVVLPLGALAAFGSLLARQDPVCWDVVRSGGGGETYERTTCTGSSTAGADTGSGFAVEEAGPGSTVGSGSTSDTVAAAEVAAAAGLVGATLTAGWLLAPSGDAVRRAGER